MPTNESNEVGLDARYKLYLALDIMSDKQVDEWEQQVTACEEFVKAKAKNPTAQLTDELFYKFLSSSLTN